MVKPELFIYQDLIGVKLDAKHKQNSTAQSFRNIGTVIDETKNTLLVQNGTTIKRYVKTQQIFRCWLTQPNGTQILLEFDGIKILGNPENRIKKIRKNRRRYQ